MELCLDFFFYPYTLKVELCLTKSTAYCLYYCLYGNAHTKWLAMYISHIVAYGTNHYQFSGAQHYVDLVYMV